MYQVAEPSRPQLAPHPRVKPAFPGFLKSSASQVFPMLLSMLWACAEIPDAEIHDEADLRTHVLTGGPMCEECEVIVEEVAVLGHPDDPASVAADPSARCRLGQLSTGEFVSSGMIGGETVLVYDSAGRAIRSIGRAGEGPGEFSRDLRIIGSGDTLVVVDRRRRQVVQLDVLGNHLDSFRLDWPLWNSARLPNGQMVFSTEAPFDDYRFRLVKVVDRRGNLIASHDLVSPELVDLMMPDMDGRRVAPAVSASYWTVIRWTYELHRWASPGRRDLVIVREAEWFRPNRPRSVGDVEAWYDTEPPPRDVFHVRETNDGLLWTYSQVPDNRWRPGPGPADVPSLHRSLDTVVEVIDIANGSVVAQRRLDERLGAVCDGSEFMTTVREMPDGDTRTIVLRLALSR